VYIVEVSLKGLKLKIFFSFVGVGKQQELVNTLQTKQEAAKYIKTAAWTHLPIGFVYTNTVTSFETDPRRHETINRNFFEQFNFRNYVVLGYLCNTLFLKLQELIYFITDKSRFFRKSPV
jgi:hypothetical protein